MLPNQAKRGRPRKFDEDTAIDSAIELFWERGFRGATTRELEAALGMRQPSIYNAFGSKKGLLVRAIDRYEKRVEGELLALLDGTGDGYTRLDAFFRALGRWIEENRYRGCLVVNLMVAEVDDDVIDERVRAYRSKIHAAILRAIQRSDVDDARAEHRANLLLAAVLGLHVTARTAAGTAEIPAMVDGLCHQIADWRRLDSRR